MNETIPGSSGMGHATAEITGNAEKKMSVRFISSGGMNCALVYNTVSTRITSCVHASRDEERRCTGGRKVDSDIIGVERMSVSVAERADKKTKHTRRDGLLTSRRRHHFVLGRSQPGYLQRCTPYQHKCKGLRSGVRIPWTSGEA